MDAVDAYKDIVHEFEDPLPVFRPGEAKQEPDDRSDSERPRAQRKAQDASAGAVQFAPQPTQPDLDSPAHILASIAGSSQAFQPPAPEDSSMLGYGFEQPNDWGVISTDTSRPSRPLTREALAVLEPVTSEPVSKAPSVQEHNATMELEEMALGREMHTQASDQRDGRMGSWPR